MQLMPMRQVAARLAVSRQHIYALIAEQAFPAPLKIGRRSLWREDEVNAWLEARSQARRG